MLLREIESFTDRVLADGPLVPQEALAFLQSQRASPCLLEIAMISFGLLEETICDLSISAEARDHNHRRPAPMWPLIFESISFRVIVAWGAGERFPDRSAPVWLRENWSIAFRCL